MAPSGAGRLGRVVVASVAVVAALLAPVGVRPAAAAEDGLSLTSSSTYTLVPEKSLVHVAIALTAKNTKPDLVRTTPDGTVTTRYFFESASIAIHAEATAVQASAGKTVLGTQITPDDGFSRLRVDFPSDLYFGQTVTLSVGYDLPGGAPRSDSDIRVGSAFATFYAWAFGDGGDVTITVPGGYDVEASGSPTQKSADAGTTTFKATGISDVTDWYTTVVADKVDALTSDHLDLPGGEHLVIRAWPEDTEWQTRVHDLLAVGLPVLVDKIGLAWPVDHAIDVTEVHTPLLEGYAGFYLPSEGKIEISEDLDELTIIHEASHAWFNDDLFVGRWIGEGLADEYASRVLDEVSNGGLGPEHVSLQNPGAQPLNAWGPPGRIDDDATQARETYGYDASWTLVRTLVDAVGEDGMRKVLAAANAKQTAYIGAGKPETITDDNDWRRLLDLLDEAGGATNADSLFRQTVLTDDQKPMLEERAAARRVYADLVAAGDGWLPGYVIRDPMGRWEFASATAAMTEARAVLDTRTKVEDAARALGLEAPPTLKTAYEGETKDLGDVQKLADRQLAVEADLAQAGARMRRERPPVTAIGLIGEDPGGELAAARAAFSAGELDAVAADLGSMDSMLDNALGLGQQRVAAAGAVALGVAAAGGAVVFAARRRRRRLAAPAGAAGAEAAAEPVATAAVPAELMANPPGAPAEPVASATEAPAELVATVPEETPSAPAASGARKRRPRKPKEPSAEPAPAAAEASAGPVAPAREASAEPGAPSAPPASAASKRRPRKPREPSAEPVPAAAEASAEAEAPSSPGASAARKPRARKPRAASAALDPYATLGHPPPADAPPDGTADVEVERGDGT